MYVIIYLQEDKYTDESIDPDALAEFSKKPLVPLLWGKFFIMVYIPISFLLTINAGNIGLPIREIEDNLEFYARLSRNHKCILFLDNGDALVSFKSRGNPYLSQINSGKFDKLW
jgi:hypothetical protein